MTRKPRLHLAPSLCHRRLMEAIRPSLAYRGGDVRVWRKKLRRKLAELLGAMPQERVPLNVRSLWKREHRLGTVEKIVFTSEPHADVPAYVCLPKNAEPPYTFFITLQGHSVGIHYSIGVDAKDERTPIEIKVSDYDFAQGCMERGIAALCVEQRSLGSRKETLQAKIHGTCDNAAMQALMIGRTLVGERVYDVDRGIDYLATRGDVDMKRIGIMGLSGGGTASVYAAAMLPRIRYAMPSGSFGDYRHSKMALYHCPCGYIPRVMLYADMADILGLFAPRPVVIAAGRKDPIVPIRSVREGFKQLKRIYAAAGAGDRCHLVVGPGGHLFFANLGWRRMLAEMRRSSQR